MQVPHTDSKRPNAAKALAAIVALVMAMSMAMLSGCAASQPAAPEEKPVTAAGYMNSMAKSSKQLSESFADFSGAVAEGDVSALQAKVDSANEVLDQMESLEAPDELKSVKGKYDEAIGTLKGALNDYLAIFLEIENAPEGAQYDFSDYGQRLESVQKAYDQGLNLLEEADKMATEM